MKRYYAIPLLLIIVSITIGCVSQQADESLDIKGSDTLVQLVANMAESYLAGNPESDVIVTGGGSGTGIASLINGEIDIADSSRPIKSKEIDIARSKGIEPWEFIIARDGLAIVVNTENQVSQLTVGQVGAIFRGEITNWNEVGGADREITLYGRQSTSGTYEFFLEHVVNWQQSEKHDYSPEMLNMEGNKAIADGVITDISGIGYVGIGYASDDLGVVNIATDENSDFITPLDEINIENGKYSITRPLYQYTAGKPEVDSITYDFLKFELSETGQQVVKGAGFYPINQEDKIQNQEKFNCLLSC